MDRRNFIKISSVLTAGSTMLTSCGRGLRQAMPVMVPEEQRVLGEEKWVNSVCGGCQAGCGVQVRLVDGRAVKMEGLPGHPVNAGRLCARGQAELQAVYNPDRIRTPRRGGQDVTWEQALDEAGAKLREAAAEPQRILLVTGRVRGLRAKLVSEFAQRLGAVHLVYEPLDEAAVLEANRLTCGFAAHPAPDYGNANYVLSFGAPLVEAGPSPVRAQRLLAHMRQGRPGRRGKLVQADARFSLTAAYADEWLPLKPGSEGTLALAIAHVLLRDSLIDKEFVARRAAGIERFRQAIAWFAPEAAASLTGIEARRIERIAHEFAANRPAIAVAGGAACGHAHSLAAAAAAGALNALAGSYGIPGGLWFSRGENTGERPVPAGQWESSLKAARVVIAYGANPLYELPHLPWKQAPFLISLSAFPDETAESAHLVLPDHTALERWESQWADGGPMGGVRSVAQPAVPPLYQSRDAAETLIALAAKAGQPLPYESWEKAVADSVGSEDDLKKALERGGVWDDKQAAAQFSFATPSKKFEFVPPGVDYASLAAAREPAGEARPLHLHVYAGVSLGTGEAANLPWLQELPDPLSQAVWTTDAELNPKTAAKLGVEDGERIWVASQRGKIPARARISPAAPPDSVVMAAGQGHTAYGRYARNRGGNVYQLLYPGAWAATRVSISRT